MAGTVVRNTLCQLIFTVGLIIVFGLVIGILNQAFFKLSGYKFGRIAGIVTGFMGVPIHEFGHALFCILFGHRITEIKLYEPNNADGVLGYVNHAYNGKSLYQQIGNFFIGFGPILFGSAVLLLLMFLLVPDLFRAFMGTANFSRILNLNVFSFSAFHYIFDIMRNTLAAFFSFAKPDSWRWWVFIIPACSIAMHMSLSRQDLKSSLAGFFFIVLIFLIANIIFYYVKHDAISVLTSYCLSAGTFLLHYLTISVILSLILLLPGIVFCLINKRV